MTFDTMKKKVWSKYLSINILLKSFASFDWKEFSFWGRNFIAVSAIKRLELWLLNVTTASSIGWRKVTRSFKASSWNMVKICPSLYSSMTFFFTVWCTNNTESSTELNFIWFWCFIEFFFFFLLIKLWSDIIFWSIWRFVSRRSKRLYSSLQSFQLTHPLCDFLEEFSTIETN